MRKTNLPARHRIRAAFTLLEVLIAVAVLGLTVASSLVAMRTGFAMIESARDNTLASQILQSEMENLRLKNWNQIAEIASGTFEMEETFQPTSADRFTCSRVVSDPAPTLREITLQVDWVGYNGTVRTRRYVTYFSKDGLNDYYYRSLQ